jgi:hypothetical protein
MYENYSHGGFPRALEHEEEIKGLHVNMENYET